MMTRIKAIAAGAAVLAVSAIAFDGAYAQSGVQSLRGGTAIDGDNTAAGIARLETGNRFDRNYRQQPPLIPHKADTYQIDLKANECIGCHDWPQNTAAGAPKISETHYVSPTGVKLNTVSNSRWFCTQCHVPQAKLEALVPNEFKSSADMY
ncbi:nitrate reductase cytochrome c-type subunit [Pseudomonadota bacterium]